MQQVRDFDPAQGQAFQGDIVFMPMPAEIAIARIDEIKPRDGRLIIQEGEASGHHHAIALPRGRNFRAVTHRPADFAGGSRDRKLGRLFGAAPRRVPAQLFRDAAAVEELRRAGLLTRTDLAIGCLVASAAVVVAHEEHDGIRLPAGNYYVGRQVESAGAEERLVAD